MDRVGGGVVVGYGGCEGREGVDVGLFFAPERSFSYQMLTLVTVLIDFSIPIKLPLPILFRINNPLPAYSKLAMTPIVLQILIRIFRNWTES
jgi:hypothetical protein